MAVPKRSPLRLVKNGKPAKKNEEPAISPLFSGKITREAPRGRRAKKQTKPVETLKSKLAELGEIYAAGKMVQKELAFKVEYAEQRIKDHCLRRYAEVYAATGKRPESLDFASRHSRFMFIQTDRTWLTLERVEELRAMNVNIDAHTELRGIRINYEAIRRHGVEKGLQKALHEAMVKMNVSQDILDECFVPDVQLKDAFFEILDNVTRESLQEGELLEEKIRDVIRVLGSASQIRNLQAVDLDLKACIKKVVEAEIDVLEEGESGAA